MQLSSSDRLAGVDGCRSGWLCVSQSVEGGELDSVVYTDARALLEQSPAPVMMTIDVPIGLVERGERECDRLARSLLGRRACCVSAAPTRELISATSHEQASAIRLRCEGKKVAVQAWSIFDRTRAIDAALRPPQQAWVREVHPELCFRQWNDGEPIAHGKRTSVGMRLRQALVEATFGHGAFERVRERHSANTVNDDDIHDAFAALFTARRIYGGAANRIPEQPALDAAGLRMEMWM